MSQETAQERPTGFEQLVDVDGILNVDKPPGITSMDVVRRVKRTLGLKRIGHGGTLDPIATGVIPVCLGRSTKMMDYMIQGTRKYRAAIELGIQTDTYDALGKITVRKDPSMVSLNEVKGALKAYTGTIEQIPPMYSALKKQGKRLYELARAGVEVEREPRTVNVIALELLDSKLPIFKIDITCGRGFYVRSFAHDLGITLGCGAHMKSLQRLRSGPFKLSDATTLDALEQHFVDDTWRTLLYAPDVTVSHLRAIVADDQEEKMIRHGRPLPAEFSLTPPVANERCRVYGSGGRFIAILSFNASEGLWHPKRVFNFSLR